MVMDWEIERREQDIRALKAANNTLRGLFTVLME